MIGLEDEVRPTRFGHRLTVDDYAYMALARQRVDALVGIARVLEKLLVFFHPLVHFRPFESKMIFQARRLGARRRVTPRRVFGAALTDLNGPIRSFTFDRTLALVLTRHEKIRAHVFFGKVISRQNLRLA